MQNTENIIEFPSPFNEDHFISDVFKLEERDMPIMVSVPF